MHQVRDKIFLGNSQDAQRPHLLHQAGVTAILNVASDLDTTNQEDFLVHKHGLVDGPGNSSEEMKAAIHCLDNLLAYGHTVLVHCHMGMSRSPTIVAKYLAMKEHSTLDSCIEELVKIRPIVNPHEALVKLARSIEGALPSQRH
jgi:protein-tyrosine phosphatase